MSILVHVTFDLDDAAPDDYKTVREHLAKIKLRGWAISSAGNLIELPSNTFLAEYEEPFTDAVRDQVADYVQAVFKACGVKGKIFITAGQGWAWKQRVV